MANERFAKVFVLDPASNWKTAAAKPNNLAAKEAGAWAIDDFGVIGANIGATPSGNTVKKIQIHQNVGDNAFGTVRTQIIDIDKVRAFYGSTASAAQQEIWTIGYDGTDTAKTITANKGETLQFHIHIYSNQLVKWYGSLGYDKTISVYTGAGSGAASAAAVAQAIADAINNANQPANDFATNTELQNYVVATVINSGTSYGVQITTNAIAPDLLNSADPIKFYEVELVTLTLSQTNPTGASSVVPVTKVQAAASGNGFPAELAAMEAESQGYDRVREVFENNRFMKTNYVILATDGKKYDYLYIQYDYTHNAGAKGATNGQITEPYTAIIVAPTTTLQTIATIFNTLLTNRKAAVTL
jgi:hypothetical protein